MYTVFSLLVFTVSLVSRSWAADTVVEPKSGVTQTKTEAVSPVKSDPVVSNVSKAESSKESKIEPDTRREAVERANAAKYQPEEALAILPISCEKGLVFDLGSTTVSKTESLTLKNNGKKAITIKAVTIGQPFTITKNGCVGQLAAAAKCDLAIQFQAKSRGSYSTRLQVTASGPYEPDTWIMAVKGNWQDAPILRVRGDFNFGEMMTGKRAERKITIVNDGDIKATQVEIAIGNSGQFFMGKDDCNGAIEAGKTCSATVVFESKIPGMLQDVLKVTHKTTERVAAETAISGVGLRPAKLAFTVSEGGALGNKVLGLKLEFDWIVANIGDYPADKIEDSASIKAPFSYRRRPFPGEGGTCKKTLGPRESCRVSATFAPLFPGDAQQEFALKYFDGQEPQTVTMNFTGHGLTPARIVVKETAPGALQPVLVTKGTDRKFHIVNEGDSDASDLKIVPNDFNNQWKLMSLIAAEEGELCQNKTVLKPKEGCEFGVAFMSDKGGDFEASVGIRFFDSFRQQTTKFPFKARALSTARITFEDKAGLNYGKILPNESKVLLLKLTNDGEHRIERLKLEGMGEPFSIKDKAESEMPHRVCGEELEDAKSCVFPIEFKNTLGAVAEKTLKLKFFDGLKETEVSYAIKAVGQKAAQLELVEGKSVDLGEQLTTSETEKAVQFKNVGDLSVRDLSVKINAPDGAPITISDNSCVESLDAGKTCNLKVKFKPTEVGDIKVSLHATYADEYIGQKSTDIEVTGKAKLPARLAFEGAAIDFGTVKLGEEVERTVVLRNDGGIAAKKLFANFGGTASGYNWKGGKFPGDGGDCLDELLAKANCKLVIVYKDDKGEKTAASLILSYDDGVKSQRLEVGMGGNSVIPGNVAFNKGMLDFGQRLLGPKNIETVVVKNAGGVEVEFLQEQTEITGAFGFTGGKYPGESGTCGAKLDKETDCILQIEMKGDHEEAYEGKLNMVFKDVVTPKTDLSLPLAGSLKQPAVIVGEGGGDFGNVFVGDKKTISVELRNDGGWDTDVKISSSDPQLTVDGACSSVKAKDRCSLNITFTPSDNQKGLEAKLTINYSNGIEPKELVFAIKGMAEHLARISLGKSVLDFGTLSAMERRNKLVTLKNEGDVEASQLELVGLKDQAIGFDGTFPGKTGTCSDTLKPGAECVIDLSYSPTQAGTNELNLEFKYFNGKESITAPLMVRGLAEAPVGNVNREIASEPAPVTPGAPPPSN